MVAAGARIGLAHAFSTSSSKIQVDGRQVHVSITLNLLDLHKGPPVDLNHDGLVSYDELDDGIERIYAAVKENYHIRAARPPSKTSVERYQLVDHNVLQMDMLYVF